MKCSRVSAGCFQPAPPLAELAGCSRSKAASGNLRGKCGLLSTGRRITDVGVLGFFWYVSPTQSHHLRPE